MSHLAADHIYGPDSTHVGPELCEFQTPRINLDDVLRFRHVTPFVADRSSLDRSTTFALAILASPDEVGFTSATREVVHIMPRHTNHVWMCFAT